MTKENVFSQSGTVDQKRNLRRALSGSFRTTFLLFIVLRDLSISLTKVDALYETTFLVGPEPQPLLPDSGKDVNPLGPVTLPDGAILPEALFPYAVDEEGNRKLMASQTRRHTANLQSVQSNRDRMAFERGPEEEHLRADNISNPLFRSLGEDCTITTTILGFGFDDDVTETGVVWNTPDPHGAAGTSRLVAVGNSMMEVRRKTGTLALRRGFQNFFNAFPEASDTNFFYDPRVVYDEHTGRFVIVVFQQRYAPDVSRIWLAVSKDETPDTIADWNQVYINSALSINGSLSAVDFTGLEVDEEAVYVTANMFQFSGGGYAGVRLWIIAKGLTGGLYRGDAPSFMVYNPMAGGGSPGTTMPAQIHGSTGVDGSVGTFLSNVIVYPDGQTYLQIVTIINPLSSPIFHTVQIIDLGIITQGAVLPLAPQRGTSTKIATNDARILDAVWRNNQLWVVFTINPLTGVNEGQATAHWVRCRTSGGNVTYEARGNMGGEGIATGTFTFFPSVAVNTRGLVAFGYAASSPTTYAGAYVSVGASEQSYTVKSGLDSYVRQYGAGRNRWGDYSGIAVDPTDDSFWVFNQYADTVGSPDAGGNGRWKTAWGRLECMPTPSPAPGASPIDPPSLAPVTRAPTQRSCGLFGLGLFCFPFFCGPLGRLLCLCRN